MLTDWLEQNRIICPDCGAGLGNRTLTGHIQIVTSHGVDHSRCVHPRDPNAKGIQCPRVKEAISAAEQSHARGGQ